MRRTAWRARVVMVMVGAGCSAPEASAPPPIAGEPARWVGLVDPSGWTFASDEDDPLPDHRPQPRVCSPQPWHVFSHGIQADTADCNYFSLTTPLASSVRAGDTLAIDVWWSTLAATEPAQGHLALFVGGQPLWALEVGIPGPADARHFEFIAPFDAVAGEDVLFHLHNHGFNTWTLAGFSVLELHGEPTP